MAASPVPTLLAQLTPPPAFEQLASEVSRVRAMAAGALVTTAGKAGIEPRVTLRVRRGVGALIATAPMDALASRDDVIAADPATKLVLVRLNDQRDPASLPAWLPQSLEDDEYLVATTVSSDGDTSFMPLFVGGLDAEPSRTWSGSLWRLPHGAHVTPGSFVFSTTGELAGVTVDDGPDTAIVPADVLRASAAALIDAPPAGGGWLGIDIGALTPALARATTATSGVIVSWVDPLGPAAGVIWPGDVIEAVDSGTISTPDQWAVSIARLRPGGAIMMRVRSNGASMDVGLVAAAQPPDTQRPLGLHLRHVPGTGSIVTEVDEASAADRAGIQPGDVITRAGSMRAPSPGDVRTVYRDVTADHPLLVAVTRDAQHLVLTVH